jgi:hypothetical protein
MAKAALGVGESEREGSRRGARVSILFREGHRRLPRERHSGGEGEPHEAPGSEANALAHADDRVEERPVVPESERPSSA